MHGRVPGENIIEAKAKGRLLVPLKEIPKFRVTSLE
jgi:hypothetical protein